MQRTCRITSGDFALFMALKQTYLQRLYSPKYRAVGDWAAPRSERTLSISLWRRRMSLCAVVTHSTYPAMSFSYPWAGARAKASLRLLAALRESTRSAAYGVLSAAQVVAERNAIGSSARVTAQPNEVSCSKSCPCSVSFWL